MNSLVPSHPSYYFLAYFLTYLVNQAIPPIITHLVHQSTHAYLA
jgi:hypothetical protein